ncbi:MAG: SAM-dependent methyltransferase [Proteobacteria bacterium]|nr:SAM-dependent methyltransferase [Pseudomonadota bacterium]
MNSEIATLWPGTSEPLLKALHILTREGKLNADSRRKLKQVQHLTRLIEPFLKETLVKTGHLRVVDLGAGKSYLGFILYDLVLRSIPEASLTAIESRPELIEASLKIARDSGFDRMRFVSAKIEEAVSGSGSGPAPEPADFVCTLHACDTATDDAILYGLAHGAHAFALVPCCQAEVARSLEGLATAALDAPELRALFGFPIHRREFGSHLTNVIRTLFLSSKGYRVTVTELVGWEHSMKNELILAQKISDEAHPESLRAKERLEALLKRFPVRMKLLGN